MKLRNCAWSPPSQSVAAAGKVSGRPVWVRRNVLSMACPKSIITGSSLEMLERFGYWKLAGGGSLMNEEAKVAEAMLFLNEQWIEEEKHVKTEE